MGSLTQDAIKIKKSGNTATVPLKEVLADRFSSSVPAPASFLDVLKELEDYTKDQIREKEKQMGIKIKEPHQNAFNNCRGGWSEFIFAAYSWNELAEINRSNYESGGPIYIFVKLPNNKNDKTKWTAALDDKHGKVIRAFDRTSADDEEVRISGHESFLLNSSNPDVAIFKYSRKKFDSLCASIPLNPCEDIKDLSLDTQEKLEKVFDHLKRTVAPRKNLHCFLSVKDSLKPDRRLQFLHEGNNVKTILLYLINERNACDTMLQYNILHNMYYAISFSIVSPGDRKSLDAAMVACLTSPSLPKTWAVDKLFECLSQNDVKQLYSSIITPPIS
ncbi:MAG: hypothetical protein E7474_06475 [Ruminococcaceae bacterium]|nr:hypothetical protein [Oscillospiraceae bacterium]